MTPKTMTEARTSVDREISASACWRAFRCGERRLELEGISTAVLEGGSGAQVVLLHGPGRARAQVGAGAPGRWWPPTG